MMLLCLSSRHWCLCELPVEVAGEVAFEAADGFACGLAFAGSAGDVVAGGLVDAAAVDQDGVEGLVELAVAAAVEAVAVVQSARGGDRGGAGEACEGGFVAEAAVVGVGHDCLGSADRSHACLGE